MENEKRNFQYQKCIFCEHKNVSVLPSPTRAGWCLRDEKLDVSPVRLNEKRLRNHGRKTEQLVPLPVGEKCLLFFESAEASGQCPENLRWTGDLHTSAATHGQGLFLP